jgi:hypothetical protein
VPNYLSLKYLAYVDDMCYIISMAGKNENTMKSDWEKISGPKCSDHLCERCHSNLTLEGHEFCRSCEISIEIEEDFKEHDKTLQGNTDR